MFAVDRTSDARSVAGRPRFVKRPAGIVVVRGRHEGKPAYRDGAYAGEDAAIRFRARYKAVGLVVLAVFFVLWGIGCAASLVLRPSLAAPPTRDDTIFRLGVAALLIVSGPLAAFIGLRRNTFSIRVGGGFIVAERGGGECFRVKRESIAQIACVSAVIRDGNAVRPRYDLVALNAQGTQTPMLQDVPPTHALFAEVWLEDVLGLADVAVDRELI